MPDTPRAPDTPKATKAEVIAWMRENNASARSAAKHFNLSINTMNVWVRLARNPAPTEQEPDPKPEPKPMLRLPPVSQLTALAEEKRKGVLPNLEAIAPPLAARLRAAVLGISSELADVATIRRARAVAEAERARMKAAGATAKAIDAACPLPPRPDLRQADSGARALRTLFETAPGLAAFGRDTGEEPAADASSVLAEIDAVLLAEPVRPARVAPLRVVGAEE